LAFCDEEAARAISSALKPKPRGSCRIGFAILQFLECRNAGCQAWGVRG
jgi:hypothetical protein